MIEVEQNRYDELIKAEQRAEQYKKAILQSSNNNQLTKVMTCIEGKNLFELLQEEREEN